MTEVTDELKPCPFCGGTELFKSQAEGITCRGCNAQVLGAGTTSDVDTWNRRAALSVPAQGAEPLIYVSSQQIPHDPKHSYIACRLRPEGNFDTPLYLHPTPAHSGEAEQCERCQGNGEIVTDWERYMHARDGDVGDEAVEECPDCNGEGWISPAHSGEREALERSIRAAGLKARDEVVDGLSGDGSPDNDLADYLERIVDACVRAAIEGTEP